MYSYPTLDYYLKICHQGYIQRNLMTFCNYSLVHFSPHRRHPDSEALSQANPKLAVADPFKE